MHGLKGGNGGPTAAVEDVTVTLAHTLGVYKGRHGSVRLTVNCKTVVGNLWARTFTKPQEMNTGQKNGKKNYFCCTKFSFISDFSLGCI